MESIEKSKIICDVLSSKKAYDIVKLDVKEKTVLADYFIICSGKSSTQVRALADYAIDEVEKFGGEVRRKEGMDEGRWVVVDFGDVNFTLQIVVRRDFVANLTVRADFFSVEYYFCGNAGVQISLFSPLRQVEFKPERVSYPLYRAF